MRERGMPGWLRIVGILFVVTLVYLGASLLTRAIDMRDIAPVEGLHYVLPQGCIKEADCQSEVRRYLIVSGDRQFQLTNDVKDDDFVAGDYISWRKFCPLWQNDCTNIVIWKVSPPEFPEWAKQHPTPEPNDRIGG